MLEIILIREKKYAYEIIFLQKEAVCSKHIVSSLTIHTQYNQLNKNAQI